jgi:hypothetical protein
MTGVYPFSRKRLICLGWDRQVFRLDYSSRSISYGVVAEIASEDQSPVNA